MTASPAAADLVFRSGYLDDPLASRALADLLRDTFDIDISVLDRLGGPDPTSVPFGYFDRDGICVANLTVFAMPLVIGGTFVRAAGLQSGAVRPAWRGQGLYRTLMAAALDHCAAEGYEAIALLTDKPALYERHGFRTVPQHRFIGPAPQAAAAGPARRLRLEDEADAGLLRKILQARRPISDRLAPFRQIEMFLFNAALAPQIRLHLMEDSGAVVAWEAGADGTFELLDIAGPAIPPLAAIIGALAPEAARVRVHFAPDHLGWEGEAVADDGDLALMLRGADGLVPQEPLALSPMAEF